MVNYITFDPAFQPTYQVKIIAYLDALGGVMCVKKSAKIFYNQFNIQPK